MTDCDYLKHGECKKVLDLIKENDEQWKHINEMEKDKVGMKIFTLYAGLIILVVSTIAYAMRMQTAEVGAQITNTQKEIVFVVKEQANKQENSLKLIDAKVNGVLITAASFHSAIDTRVKFLENGHK